MHYHVLPIGKCSWHVHRKEVLTAIPHRANLEEELQELGQRGSYLHDEKANACLKGKKINYGNNIHLFKGQKDFTKMVAGMRIIHRKHPYMGFCAIT